MIKKKDVVSFFYVLIGSISTFNFCKGRPSAMLNSIKELPDEFSESELDECLAPFDNEGALAVKKIKKQFITNLGD